MSEMIEKKIRAGAALQKVVEETVKFLDVDHDFPYLVVAALPEKDNVETFEMGTSVHFRGDTHLIEEVITNLYAHLPAADQLRIAAKFAKKAVSVMEVVEVDTSIVLPGTESVN